MHMVATKTMMSAAGAGAADSLLGGGILGAGAAAGVGVLAGNVTTQAIGGYFLGQRLVGGNSLQGLLGSF